MRSGSGCISHLHVSIDRNIARRGSDSHCGQILLRRQEGDQAAPEAKSSTLGKSYWLELNSCHLWCV